MSLDNQRSAPTSTVLDQEWKSVLFTKWYSKKKNEKTTQ